MVAGLKGGVRTRNHSLKHKVCHFLLHGTHKFVGKTYKQAITECDDVIVSEMYFRKPLYTLNATPL